MTTSEREILHAAGRALHATTGVEVEIRPLATGKAGGANAVVDVLIQRRKHRFHAQVKTVDRFATPALIQAQGKKWPEPPLLVAPFITREVAERCRQLGMPFIDTAGNAYLEGPGLFLYVVGQPKPAERRESEFRALNPAGLRIVFALVCRPALLETSYREIAARAGVALGTVGPVLKDLEARGYVHFRKGLAGKLVAPDRMIEEWVTHYPVALRPKLHPRRFQADPERLEQIDLAQQHAYWGGEVAGEKLTRYLRPERFTIYAREPIARLVAAARMRADVRGNVEVLETFWHFEGDAKFPNVVPPMLAYADLLATQDGRNAEAARMIYEQRIAPQFGTAQ